MILIFNTLSAPSVFSAAPDMARPGTQLLFYTFYVLIISYPAASGYVQKAAFVAESAEQNLGKNSEAPQGASDYARGFFFSSSAAYFSSFFISSATNCTLVPTMT